MDFLQDNKLRSLLPYYSAAVLILLLSALYGLVHIPLRIIGIIAVAGIFLIIRLRGGLTIAYYGAAILALVHALLYRFSHADAVVTFAGLAVMLFALVRLSGAVLEREKGSGAVSPSFTSPDEGNGGDEATLRDIRSALASMDELKRSIQSEKIAEITGQLRGLCRKILDEVEASPEKLPKVKGFTQFYLPTTVKILQSYRHAEAAGIEGANISDLKRRIESMLDPPILEVFHKQLDSLFGDEALDISTDITVLQNMLAQEGLYGEKLSMRVDSSAAGAKQ